MKKKHNLVKDRHKEVKKALNLAARYGRLRRFFVFGRESV